MIDAKAHEATLELRDEAILNPKGLLLAPVGIDARMQIKPAAVMLQVVHELMDGYVIFGGVGEIGPDIDNIMVLVQAIDRAGDVILAHPMTEPTRRLELDVGHCLGNGITRKASRRGHDVQNPFVHKWGLLATGVCLTLSRYRVFGPDD